MNLEQKIEAILFWKAEPLSFERLAKMLETEKEEIEKAIPELEKNLENRGVHLIKKENEIMLGTAPELSELIASLTKEELLRDLGKAGQETLAIIIYRGPVSRSEIDYIRGVNSQFILRNLLIRGIVERIENPSDKRVFMYKPTFELLQYLGVAKVEDLPEYERIRSEMEMAADIEKEENTKISKLATETNSDSEETEQIEQ